MTLTAPWAISQKTIVKANMCRAEWVEGPWKAVPSCAHTALLQKLNGKKNGEKRLRCEFLVLTRKTKEYFDCRIYCVLFLGWDKFSTLSTFSVHRVKCLLTKCGRAGWENIIWLSIMKYGPCCARSVRQDLEPNIFSFGPPNLIRVVVSCARIFLINTYSPK